MSLTLHRSEKSLNKSENFSKTMNFNIHMKYSWDLDMEDSPAPLSPLLLAENQTCQTAGKQAAFSDQHTGNHAPERL